MPQGRRKVPFSGKAKKAQLLSKREKKEDISTRGDDQDEHGRREKSENMAASLTASDKSTILTDVHLHGKGSSHRYDLVYK
jgi:hypothetical protein